MKSTGEKIRLIREMKGFSQENMADMMNITRMAYGMMERGQRNLNEARIAQIAKILGVTPKDIHNFDDKMANFFDQANQNVAFGNSASQHTNHYYDQQESRHQLEKAQLEIENLNLELENQRINREKAELEATLWRERYERVIKPE